MKNNLISSILLVLSNYTIAQSTHTLTATDHKFTPDTLYMQPGDTVELINIGYHSATEVDSIDWINNNANHNGGFYVGFGAPTSSKKFTINNTGTYYNICVPHADMAMKSIIIVESNTNSLREVSRNENIRFYPNPTNNYITVQNSKTLIIYSLTGQIVMEKQLSYLVEQIDVEFLPKGTYIVVLDEQKKTLIIQ